MLQIAIADTCKMPVVNNQTTGKAIAGWCYRCLVLFLGLFGARLFSDLNMEFPFRNIDEGIKGMGF